MIMKANKQIGFIYKDNESIDKILKDGEVVFERGFLREKTSTTLPITFGGVGKNLKDYRVYGNTVQSKLPSGYTQVDYIESSGTQYIDTGFKPNQDTRMIAKTYIVSASDYNNIGGARNGNNEQFHIIIANNRFDARYGTKSSNISQIPTGFKEFNFNKNNIYINDMLENTFDVQTFQSSYNAYIFCVNNAGTPSQFANYKLYNMKWYDNDVLVRDFIPCYRNSDNEVGLYDLVNGVFYTNQGTGVFTYGNIAPTPDAPIEIVSCGDRTKNLFDKVNATYKNGYYKDDNGVEQTTQNSGYLTSYIKVKPNTAYTIQGLLKQINQSSQAYGIYYYNTNKEWISRAITTTNPPYTFTTPNNCYFIQFQYRQAAYDEDTIQIEEGSTATSYEPYGYKIPVNVRSDNLFDKDDINIEDNKYLTSDGSYSDNSNFKVTDYIPIKSSIIYNLSPYKNYSAYECFYDENKTFISSIQIKNINNTFTTPSNAKFIRLSVRKSDNDVLTLAEDSITNIYLDEPLRKIGEYSDYIDFKNGKVVRNIGNKVLDGSENGWYISGKAAKIKLPDAGLTNISELYNYSGSLGNLAYCDYFTQAIPNTLYTSTSSRVYVGFGIAVNPSTSAGLFFANNDISLSDFKTWLTTNNTTVDYVLETPTQESITLPNIPTIDGNNTLNIETEITPSQVYIKYKSNT